MMDKPATVVDLCDENIQSESKVADVPGAPALLVWERPSYTVIATGAEVTGYVLQR